MRPTAGSKINYIIIVNKTVRGALFNLWGGGGGEAGLCIPAKIIRPATPGLEIYFLFHEEPVPVFFLNTPPPPPPHRLNGAWSSRNVGLVSVCYLQIMTPVLGTCAL